MTRKKAIDLLDNLIGMVEDNSNSNYDEALKMGIKALKQETVSKESYDHEYFLRKKMEVEIDHLRRYISKLETQITLEQEPFINKPCVSEKVCEHDKQMVLDKIRAKIEGLQTFLCVKGDTKKVELSDVLDIIDKYNAESDETDE